MTSTTTSHEQMTGSAYTNSRRKPTAIRISAVQMGIAGGLMAVVIGTLFEVRPPEAYGICMACHGRDLLNWTLNMLLHTHLTVASASAVFPVLTTIGVLLGALVGAKTSGEFRWYSPESSLKEFLYGALVMNFALLAGGCSIRLLLRSAAGDWAGVMGFGGMIAGVILGTVWLRWRAVR
jgi:sulfur transporter